MRLNFELVSHVRHKVSSVFVQATPISVQKRANTSYEDKTDVVDKRVLNLRVTPVPAFAKYTAHLTLRCNPRRLRSGWTSSLPLCRRNPGILRGPRTLQQLWPNVRCCLDRSMGMWVYFSPNLSKCAKRSADTAWRWRAWRLLVLLHFARLQSADNGRGGGAIARYENWIRHCD